MRVREFLTKVVGTEYSQDTRKKIFHESRINDMEANYELRMDKLAQLIDKKLSEEEMLEAIKKI